MKPPEPESRDEVVANIHNWDENARNLHFMVGSAQRSLKESMTRAMGWAFIYRNNRWIGAPLKYCGGAKKMTPNLYDAHRLKISGTAASNLIGELFSPDDPSDTWNEIDATHPAVVMLNGLAKSLGHELRSDARFYILRGEGLADNVRQQVEKLAALIRKENLSEDALDALQQRMLAD